MILAKFITRALAGIVVAAIGFPAAAQQTLPPNAALLPLRFEESTNPAQQQFNYFDFMWRSFIAVNWPNVPITTGVVNGKPAITRGFRGQPDLSRSILSQRGAGTLAVSVWETYREPREIFLPPDQWPNYPTWNTPRLPPIGVSVPEGARLLKRWPEGTVEYPIDIAQPFYFPDATGPLIDQNRNYVRYEVAVNQAFFTYVRFFQYFNAARQIAAVAASVRSPGDPAGFQRPPFGFASEFAPGGYLSGLPDFARQGLVDVKAAWRVLDPSKGDRPERYLHRVVVIDNVGNTRLLGLAALHILRYTPNGNGAFVAATFEQVDNTDILPGFAAPGLKPSFNSGRPPTDQQRRLGFQGKIPPLQRQSNPTPVDIYRVTPLPLGDLSVSAANAKYQAMLKGSVFQFYRLIGTQNRHPSNTIINNGNTNLNGYVGPITGVYTNTSNLINAALESYSQKNFSCIHCHVRARPQGTRDDLIAAGQVDTFKILTFLLQAAKMPK